MDVAAAVRGVVRISRIEAYVIVVHRAMDLRFVIRQGVQYLLARGTIRAIQLAVSAAIIVIAVSMRATPGIPTPTEIRIVLVFIGLAAVLVIGRFAERLRRWFDRRFFREAYNAEQILGELANNEDDRRDRAAAGNGCAPDCLKYVNAGHNPPMVLRNSGGMIRLEVGGPVVVLIPGCVYKQSYVTREPEDVLVAFTDGVSEAMNVDMEEWGEERLIAATQRNRTLRVWGLTPIRSITGVRPQ